jgi:1-acyl-sn-glycerol-3-phosphate acyltransferase
MKNSRSIEFGTRRRSIRDRVRTTCILGTLLAALMGYVLLLGPFLLVVGLTSDRRRRTARKAARRIFAPLIRHHCRVWGSPLKVELGGVNFSEMGPCIVVANHVSSLDVLMLMQLPAGAGDGRVWAKGWPFRMPLLGALMRLSGHLRVDDFNLLPEARDRLDGGETMLVFPESSRSRTGRLGRFRDGAFLLSVRTARPIVPVAIHGTFDCFPPGQMWVNRPALRVEVLGVLKPEGTGQREHVMLKQRAHGMIAAALAGSAESHPVVLAAAS